MQFLLDASTIYRGLSQTTGVLKGIACDGLGNNSPFSCIQTLLYEGDDSYANVCAYAQNTIDELMDVDLNGIELELPNDEGGGTQKVKLSVEALLGKVLPT